MQWEPQSHKEKERVVGSTAAANREASMLHALCALAARTAGERRARLVSTWRLIMKRWRA
jgi:hypothetical protein